MNIDKIKGYLNIAKKAGYVIIGGEKLENYNKKLYLVIYDKSAQKNTLKIVRKIQNKDIKIIELENLETLININNCKIIGIKNKNLSDIIINLMNE